MKRGKRKTTELFHFLLCSIWPQTTWGQFTAKPTKTCMHQPPLHSFHNVPGFICGHMKRESTHFIVQLRSRLSECVYAWSFISHFHKMCNMSMTPECAEKSRTAIEYSEHTHTQCSPSGCQMAVTMETSSDVYGTRVHLPFTLVKKKKPATRWTKSYELWRLCCVCNATFSSLLISQSIADTKDFTVQECGRNDAAAKLETEGRQRRNTNEWKRDGVKIKRRISKGRVELTHHWTLLSSSLVWKHLTDQSPENKQEKQTL